jgi:hypothetical protein
MKYFTPELYLRGQSTDDAVVEAAEDAWEQAILDYRKHCDAIAPQLSETLRQFRESHLCLHDAEVFGLAKLSMTTLPWRFQDVVLLAKPEKWGEEPEKLLFLHFGLTAEPVVERWEPDQSKQSGDRVFWLYEEIDVVSPGVFSLEIMFHNGLLLKLQFQEFRWLLAEQLALFQGDASAVKDPPAQKAVA